MKSQNGFTLMEIVIVIVVIGILLSIAVPKFGNLQDTANLTAAKSNVSSLKAAASMYYANQAVSTGRGSYPANKTALEALLEQAVVWPTGYGYTYVPATGTITLTTP